MPLKHPIRCLSAGFNHAGSRPVAQEIRASASCSAASGRRHRDEGGSRDDPSGRVSATRLTASVPGMARRLASSPHLNCGPFCRWLATDHAISDRTRRFTLVSCLPVLVLGMGTARTPQQPTAHGPALQDQRLACCRRALRTSSPGTSQIRIRRAGPLPSAARPAGPSRCPCTTAIAGLNTRRLTLALRGRTSTTSAVSPRACRSRAARLPAGSAEPRGQGLERGA